MIAIYVHLRTTIDSIGRIMDRNQRGVKVTCKIRQKHSTLPTYNF